MFRQLLESLDKLNKPVKCSDCKNTGNSCTCHPAKKEKKKTVKEDIIPANVVKPVEPGQEELKAHMHSRNPKVRELVAKHIDIHILPLMMNDDDEAVRIEIAKRIDQRYLERYEYDPSEDVRYVVVTRTENAHLLNRMKQDIDPYIARRAVYRLRYDQVGHVAP